MKSKSILIIAANPSVSTTLGWPVGFWGAELTHAWYAFTEAGYDVPACHAFLDTSAGQDCLTTGCAVRRACPVSQSYGRVPEQSAYHMRQFHR